MPGVDRSAPLRFLRTAYQPDDWIAVFLKSYETGRVVQRVGPLAMVVTPRYQAWLRSQNARRYNVYIGVNGIAPGYFRTQMNKSLFEDPKFNAWVCGRTPLGRWAEPSESAVAAR